MGVRFSAVPLNAPQGRGSQQHVPSPSVLELIGSVSGSARASGVSRYAPYLKPFAAFRSMDTDLDLVEMHMSEAESLDAPRVERVGRRNTVDASPGPPPLPPLPEQRPLTVSRHTGITGVAAAYRHFNPPALHLHGDGCSGTSTMDQPDLPSGTPPAPGMLRPITSPATPTASFHSSTASPSPSLYSVPSTPSSGATTHRHSKTALSHAQIISGRRQPVTAR